MMAILREADRTHGGLVMEGRLVLLQPDAVLSAHELIIAVDNPSVSTQQCKSRC